MTEDMLDQHASVLVNLGTSDDAALLRAKIQSASLLSDMQSFKVSGSFCFYFIFDFKLNFLLCSKAANPECVLEDFVRWYSPRDWLEYIEKTLGENGEEIVTKRYDLSARMKMPGNIWLDVWRTAKPVPVRRQKRLFDDTKEAENVNNFLLDFEN